MNRYHSIPQEKNDDSFTRIIRLACLISGKPLAFITLRNNDNIWGNAQIPSQKNIKAFNTAVGHYLDEKKTFIEIEDTSLNMPFDGQAFIDDNSFIYCSIFPLVNPENEGIGHICLLDSRKGKLRKKQIQGLQDLANETVSQIQRQTLSKVLKRTNRILKTSHNLARSGGWEFEVENQNLFWTENLYVIHGLPINYNISVEKALSFYEIEYRNKIESDLHLCISKQTEIQGTYKIKTEQNKSLWVRVYGKPYIIDDKVTHIYGSFQDVTDYEKAKNTATNVKRFSDAVIENMSDGLSINSEDGLQLDANEPFCKMTGFSKKELYGKKPPFPYWPPEEYDTIAHAFSNSRKDKSGEFELIFMKKNGERFPVSVSVATFINPQNQYLTYLANVKDLSNHKKRDQELRRQKETLDHIIKAANIGTWEWHIQEDRAIINERYATMLGYSIEELQPFSFQFFLSLTHQDHIESIKDAIWKHIDGSSEFYEIEYRMRHKNGSWIWILAKGQISKWSDDGKPTVMYGTNQDITIRKEALIELVKSTDMLHKVSKIGRIGGWDKNLITGEDYWSKITKEIHEVSDDFEPNMENSIAFYKDGESLERISNAVKHTIETGEPYDIEVKLITAKNNEIWVRTSGEAEFKNGKCYRIYGLIQDIDQKKRAEIRLNELSYVAANTKDAVIITDIKGLITWVNKAFVLETGYQKNFVIGKRPSELLHGKDTDPNTVQEFLNAFQTERSFQHEILNYRRDGTSYWANLSINPVFDEQGKCIRYFAINRNISEKIDQEIALTKAMNDAKSANKAKSEFLANMSHEIRTPLNGLLGFIELLSDTKISDEQKTYIRNIEISGSILLKLINNILDLSKIEAGKYVLEPTKVHLKELTSNIYNTLDYLAKQKDLQLHIEISSDVPEIIIADERKLLQVLINLLGNAIKFTKKGSITLRINRIPETKNIPILQFVVEDSGIGISEDKIQEIFEAFTQNNPSQQNAGTGIGLTISSHITRLWGSEIAVQSTLGTGSQFSFELPLHESTTEKLDDTTTGFSISNLDLKRVLLVDDSEINLMISRLMLQKLFPETLIYTAESGYEAIAIFQEQQPDFIFMDLQMPGMDGFETTKKIRGLENTRNCIPIVALTANILSGNRQKCLDAGMNDFLTKPVMKQDLKAAIIRNLSGFSTEENFAEPQKEEHHEDLIIDIQILKSLQEKEPEMYEAIISSIKSGVLQNYSKDLEDAIQDQNFNLFQSIGHKLYGSSKMFYANRLSKIGKELKSITSEVAETQSAELLDRLKHEISELEKTVSKL